MMWWDGVADYSYRRVGYELRAEQAGGREAWPGTVDYLDKQQSMGGECLIQNQLLGKHMSDNNCANGEYKTIPTPPDFSARLPKVTEQLNRIFEALADPHCRCILYHLHPMQGEVAERAELVDTIRKFTGAEGVSEESMSAESAAQDIHHRVLPRLQNVGCIEYDLRNGTVRYRETPAMNEWLEHAFHKEIGEAT